MTIMRLSFSLKLALLIFGCSLVVATVNGRSIHPSLVRTLQPEEVTALEIHSGVGVPGTWADLTSLCDGWSPTGCEVGRLANCYYALNNPGKTGPMWAAARRRTEGHKKVPLSKQELSGGALLPSQAEVQTDGRSQLSTPFPISRKTGNFDYSYTNGRLTQVSGFVVPVGTSSSPGALADKWVSALFVYVFGGAVLRTGPKYSGAINPNAVDAGHIVAASLGGSNDDMYNFFPQTYASNHGAYYNAETFAAMMRDYYRDLPGAAQDCVRFTITFAYPTTSWKAGMIATSGTYIVEWNHHCKTQQPSSWCRHSQAWLNEISQNGKPGTTPEPDAVPATSQSCVTSVQQAQAAKLLVEQARSALKKVII